MLTLERIIHILYNIMTNNETIKALQRLCNKANNSLLSGINELTDEENYLLDMLSSWYDGYMCGKAKWGKK